MEKAIRVPVDYRYDTLNWEFIKRMAQVASYAGDKYLDPRQYVLSELTGSRAPVNHIAEHLKSFFKGEQHDYFGSDRSWHLVVIAYNAMMQFFYETGIYPGDATKPFTEEDMKRDMKRLKRGKK